jgi:hypothetical protein
MDNKSILDAGGFGFFEEIYPIKICEEGLNQHLQCTF